MNSKIIDLTVLNCTTKLQMLIAIFKQHSCDKSCY